MNKAILFVIISVFALGLAGAVSAQNASTQNQTISAKELGVADQNLLPDSPFYFFKDAWRTLMLITTFNPVKKIELQNQFATERLVELKKISEKESDPEALTVAINNYKAELGQIESDADKIMASGQQSPELDKFLQKFQSQQTLQKQVLQKISQNVPQNVAEKITEARQSHLQNFSDVMQKLQQKTNKNNTQKVCTVNSDCPTIYCIKTPCPVNTCINGTCTAVQPETANRQCQADPDCSQGMGCFDGQCISFDNVLNQGCQNLWWFDNNHAICQQQRFCGAYRYLGLRTFATKAECKTSLSTAIQCVAEGQTATRNGDRSDNCCPGLNEYPISQTNSIPATITYKCAQSHANQCQTTADCPTILGPSPAQYFCINGICQLTDQPSTAQ